MRSPRRVPALVSSALALALTAALAGGAGVGAAAPDAGSAAGPAAGKGAKGAKLRLVKSEYGPVLMNGRGKALYLFTRDPKGATECHGECAVAWPPYLTKGKPVAGRGVDPKKLGTLRRPDGTRQLMYARRPLYFYEHDTPGNILCQDVFEFGGRWLLVKASGKPLR